MTTAHEVREMFSRIVPEYRSFNKWSSLGLDGCWRRRLARELADRRAILDVGTGTGDLAALLSAQKTAFSRAVVGADFSFEMLSWARRYPPRGVPSSVLWTQASADGLPFAGGSFDAVVSAFVLRNLKKAGILEASAREFARVLEPGGRLLFLDLTQPANGLLRWGHRLYTRTLVPLVGRSLLGPRWPGAYLADSIDELGGADALAPVFDQAGFRDFRIDPLWGGIVSLISCERTQI